MFSSIASFIFGSNTSATATATTSPTTNCDRSQLEASVAEQLDGTSIQPEHTIQVTSLTPSVTGTSVYRGGKRGGKNKRNRQQANRNGKRQAPKKPTPSITKLLTPTGDDSGDEPNFDEDDWFIVEKEEEHDEEESLPRTDDSEEDLPVVEVGKPKPTEPSYAAVAAAAAAAAALHNGNGNGNVNRRRANITSHSLYSGPRPQQQRNHLQRQLRSGAGPVSLAILSTPPRGNSPIDVGGVTQSLYVASHDGGDGLAGFGANASMEESWFVTPPPCFTSIGPIHMETSPFENLLIEHPSMSVYHSIRSAQEATESFVNLDLGVEESQQAVIATTNNNNNNNNLVATVATGVATASNGNNGPVVQRRNAGARIDRFSAAQLKQELMARNTQKNREEKERQNLCRSAIKRANKVRDFQGKANRQRRADLQHSKVLSGANNNRKCCF